MKRSYVDSGADEEEEEKEAVDLGVVKRTKESHQLTFPAINDSNGLATFMCVHFPCQETDLLYSPGFMMVYYEMKAYVFPLSMLLNKLNNTMEPVFCQMVDYDIVQLHEQYGYFNNNGLIACSPMEESMYMTKKNIKDFLAGHCYIGSRGFGTIIRDSQYPDGVMVFSVMLKQNKINTFYVPLCTFLDPKYWPEFYKNCYMPFRES